jgi:hypothetical protein
MTVGSPDGTERREHARVEMALAVRVQGRDPDGGSWEEMSTTEVASANGLAFRLQRATRLGEVLHVSLPLPKRLRKYDLAEASYGSYVVVRNLTPDVRGGIRVGVMFLGKNPPGPESLPSEPVLVPGDPETGERRRFPRWSVRLELQVESGPVPRGTSGKEETIAEDISRWGAQVPTSLRVTQGDMVRVTVVGGGYTTRAGIRSVSIGPDGRPRLHLLFMDGPVPERLLPSKDAAEPRGGP